MSREDGGPEDETVEAVSLVLMLVSMLIGYLIGELLLGVVIALVVFVLYLTQTKNGREAAAEFVEMQNEAKVKANDGHQTNENNDLSSPLRKKVEDKKEEGWEVLELEFNRVVMGRSRKAGVVKHGVVALFTLPLTMGLGNLAYHKYKKGDIEKLVLREDGNEETIPAPFERLETLEKLQQEGAITEKEYNQKRESIMDSI